MKFPIETVLSISHRKLLVNIDEVYKILNYMMDDNLFTHQLPRAARFATPFILKQHPQLEEWGIFEEQINKGNYKEFIEKGKLMFGTELEIEKVPSGVWTYKDPIQEAEDMMGKDKVVVLKIPEKNHPDINLN